MRAVELQEYLCNKAASGTIKVPVQTPYNILRYSHSIIRGILICNLTAALLWSGQAITTKFKEYILAPEDRSVRCASLFAINGDVKNPDTLCTGTHNSEGVVWVATSP